MGEGNEQVTGCRFSCWAESTHHSPSWCPMWGDREWQLYLSTLQLLIGRLWCWSLSLLTLVYIRV